MNMGVADGIDLGWKLAAVVKGVSPVLLDSYEAERRPIALGVLALSNALLKQAIEQKGFPTNRNAITTQLGINYRGSALARDDRGESAPLRAGDRAPDAIKLRTIEGECRLFDLTRGGRFTLLNFGPETALEVPPWDLRTLHVVPKPTTPNALADTEGHLATAYGAADRTLVLIRPDGYVGLISDVGDFSSVLEFLEETAPH